MSGSTSTVLKQGGPDNGLGPTLNPVIGVPFIKTITVSAAGRDKTFTLPDNSYLHSSNNFVTTLVSGIAQGAKIVLGDGTTDNLYATTNNISALGVYAATLTQSGVSAKTISVKVTASVAASAADFTQGKFNITIIGGINA